LLAGGLVVEQRAVDQAGPATVEAVSAAAVCVDVSVAESFEVRVEEHGRRRRRVGCTGS
jgi:hypothetical protein